MQILFMTYNGTLSLFVKWLVQLTHVINRRQVQSYPHWATAVWLAFLDNERALGVWAGRRSCPESPTTGFLNRFASSCDRFFQQVAQVIPAPLVAVGHGGL
jgi:hypothetical protein